MYKNICIKLGVIFIICGVSLSFINNALAFAKDYNDDVEKTNIIIDNISKDYDILNNYITNYKSHVELNYSKFNLYLEEFPSKKQELVNDLESLKMEVNKIKIVMHDIDKNCSYDINDNETSSRCTVAKVNYDNATNSYNEIIDKYNKIVDMYNEYVKENNLLEYDYFNN